MIRRSLTQGERREVYGKCGGRCAYCGCWLDFKDMQVDHVIAMHHQSEYLEYDLDQMDNYLPACRSCNHYKSKMSLEALRKMVGRIPEVLERDSVTFQIGLRYSQVAVTPHPVMFYFEQAGVKVNQNLIAEWRQESEAVHQQDGADPGAQERVRQDEDCDSF